MKKYFPYLDLMRVGACLAVLLYHMGWLPGGYLAVGVFFALSGYLSVASAMRREEFSIWKYYKSRFLKIYLPLVVVTLLTVAGIWGLGQLGLVEESWLSMKSETTSVLLGYNNAWQLGANLDYFARHIDSPFMHLWYIAVLLQYELVFPVIYLGLRWLGKKLHKAVPVVLVILAAVASAGMFGWLVREGEVMEAYYNTFARAFAWLVGMAVGLMQGYYGGWVPWKGGYAKVIFWAYAVILGAGLVLAGADGPWFAAALIVTAGMAGRMIDYGTTVEGKGGALMKMASVTYELYLWQYPVIYAVGCIEMPEEARLLAIFGGLAVLTYVTHLALTKGKERPEEGSKVGWILGKIWQWAWRAAVITGCVLGGYQYVTAEDHSEEMAQLQEELRKNQEMMLQQQREYEQRYQEQQEELKKLLESLGIEEEMIYGAENGVAQGEETERVKDEVGQEKIAAAVRKMAVVGVGDSVMLGAVGNLYAEFPNGYFDAEVSRSTWVVNGILQTLVAAGRLGDPIVINEGANGDCSVACKEAIMATAGKREVFWVTVTNDADVHVNAGLKQFAERYENLHIVDWELRSRGHGEYFYVDGIHLTEPGRVAYVKAITEEMEKVYLGVVQKKQEEVKKAQELAECGSSGYNNNNGNCENEKR